MNLVIDPAVSTPEYGRIIASKNLKKSSPNDLVVYMLPNLSSGKAGHVCTYHPPPLQFHSHP